MFDQFLRGEAQRGMGRMAADLLDLRTEEAAGGDASQYLPFLTLPGLRGFWPMSALDAGGGVVDLVGNVINLTRSGNVKIASTDKVSYADLTGIGHLLRSDTSAFDIIGNESYIDRPGLTFGGWFRANGAPVSGKGLCGKWTGSYLLSTVAGVSPRFEISSNGSTVSGTITSDNTMSADTWHFIVGRFEPGAVSGEEMTIFMDGTFKKAASSATAIFNSTSSYYVGSHSGSANRFNGFVAYNFLCASAVPDARIDLLYQQTRGQFV